MITYQFNRRISDNLIRRLIYQIEGFGLTITASQVNVVFEKILKIEDSIEGRLAGDIEDYVLLYFSIQAAAKKLKGKKSKLLEIGVLFGASLVISRLALSDIKDNREIIGIDPLDGYYLHDDSGRSSKIDGATKLKIHKERVLKNLKANDCENVRIIQNLSQSDEAKNILEQEILFYLFIDGDHTFDGFQNDLENYFPRLQIGGIVAIDNFYDSSWTDVTSVLSERGWFERLQPIAFINRTLFCEKIGTPTKDFSFVREFNRKVVEILEFSNSKNQLHDHIKNQSNFINKSYDSLNEDIRKLRIENRKHLDDFQESIKSITSNVVNDVIVDTNRLLNINSKTTNDLAENVSRIANLVENSNTQEKQLIGDLSTKIEVIHDSFNNSSKLEKVSTNNLSENVSRIASLVENSNTQEKQLIGDLSTKIEVIHDSFKDSSKRDGESINTLSEKLTRISVQIEDEISNQNQSKIKSHQDLLSTLSSFESKMDQNLGSISDNGSSLIEDSSYIKTSLQDLRATIADIKNHIGDETQRRLENENLLLYKVNSLEKYGALYMESYMLFKIKIFLKYGLIKWFSKPARDKYNSLISLNNTLRNSIEISIEQKR